MTHQDTSMDHEEVQQCIKALKEVPDVQTVYEHTSTVMEGLRSVWVRTQEQLYLVQTPRQLVRLKVKLYWQQWCQRIHPH